MIDISNQVFTKIYEAVKPLHETAAIKNEYVRIPDSFPCVTVEEISNILPDGLYDNSGRERFSRLTYRVQVFVNDRNGKRSKAREIFGIVDGVMFNTGFKRTTYMVTPDVYNASIYAISATYETIVDENGVLYRNQI